MNRTHKISLVAAALVVAAALHWLRAGLAAPLAGYSSTTAASEVAWEQKFRALPQPSNISVNMQELSAYPHNVGTQRQHDNALWIMNRFKSYGLDAHIEQFQVLYPTPRERQLELVSPAHYTAQLKEPPIGVDPTSGQTNQLPTFVMYSADGDVTAPLVYVNYGVPADYDQLDRMGVSVRGKIVIARYGQSWRGIKPKVAYQHGAVGCLIYSDPRDDGYFQGDVYPRGPFRPDQGVQRGSVMQMETEPGDPETPGWGSTPGARRLTLDQVTTLQKIPVLPISYGDAQPLLQALDGPVAPESWRGALPITYHVGPGAATVHLVAKFNWDLAKIYDVIGVIPGSQDPNHWVIRGNHYDAWVNGANDPISGQSAMLEEARSLGELLKQGWRPRRTIVFAAWDGEEPALLGSTEWGETHADELQQKAIAYLNTDDSVKGHLTISGSHSLESFFNQVEKDVPDPQTGESLWNVALRERQAAANTPELRDAIRDGDDLRLNALGSGSDYSVFVHHLGIPSAHVQFEEPNASGGVYHSIYDDYYWYTHFGDTNFGYERALAQFMGSATMRLADAEVLPLQFTDFASNLAAYQREIETLYKSQKGAPRFDFTPLERSIAGLKTAADAYDKAFDSVGGSFDTQTGTSLSGLNQLLQSSESKLLDPAGLPRRPWYRHQIYAPGYFTGYGVKTMPGLREAIEQKDYYEAATEEAVIVKVIDAYTAQINAARRSLP